MTSLFYRARQKDPHRIIIFCQKYSRHEVCAV
jgi:hypothetical protein